MGKTFKASVQYRQRLRAPTFGETCNECGGDVKIIPKTLAPLAGQALASIEDPADIQKILSHLDDNATSAATAPLPDCRASPTMGFSSEKNKPNHSTDPLFLTCSSMAFFA